MRIRNSSLGDEKINEVITLYNSGKGCTRISEQLNMPRSKVYAILKENNILRTQKEAMQKELHNRWKGGKYKDSKGRIWLSTEEYGQILESHYTYFKYNHLKQLLNDYVIHHIDHNPANNEISNLRMMRKGEHTSLHNASKGKINKEMKTVPKYTEEVKKQAVELAKKGVALKTIQLELGPNPKATQRYLLKEGIDYAQLRAQLKEKGELKAATKKQNTKDSVAVKKNEKAPAVTKKVE